MTPRIIPPMTFFTSNLMDCFIALYTRISKPIIAAHPNMVAENIGMPFLGTYVVSRYFIDASITPEPKKSIKGRNSPCFKLMEDLAFIAVR